MATAGKIALLTPIPLVTWATKEVGRILVVLFASMAPKLGQMDGILHII